jgi:hypothetical protein
VTAAFDVRPPMPARLAGRPTQGGLVIPWIQVQFADGGWDFRARHTTKIRRCLIERLCQVDGEPLGRPLVLLGRAEAAVPGSGVYFDEPPLHPECARYTMAACPMVAGRMPSYSTRPTHSEGRRGARCPEPGCDCGGWVSTDPVRHEPKPAFGWVAVWVEDYALAVGPDGELLGAALDRPPLKVRAVGATS